MERGAAAAAAAAAVDESSWREVGLFGFHFDLSISDRR